MLLAGDIGGTKTLLGLFERAEVRPRLVTPRSFATLEHGSLESIVELFLHDAGVDRTTVQAACFGVAGPVIDQTAQLTNVPWRVDARKIQAALGGRAALLNDLEAMAYGVPVLAERELLVLQRGHAVDGGNIAVIAAGTGLGEALLHSVDGRRIPSATEAGHSDFSARSEREISLLRDLTARFGRADVEHVVSGRGLINIHRVSHDSPCAAGIDLDNHDAPAAITSAALAGRCQGCVETLDLFVEAYGAEAGNLALRSVSTGGVYVGGGIAPKILPALERGSFLRAFGAKQPLEAMLETMPVMVILNEEVGLLGAAVHAQSL